MVAKIVFVLAVNAAPIRVQSEPLPKIDLGGQFTFLQATTSRLATQQQGGLGIVFDWNPKRYVSLDLALNFLPNHRSNFEVLGFYNRGSALQGLAGVKLGKRWDRVGLFGRIRPGFVSYNQVLDKFEPLPFSFGRLTRPALDSGVTLEFYPLRHLALRYDVGNTTIFYAARRVPASPGPPTLRVPGLNANVFQGSAALVYRFRILAREAGIARVERSLASRASSQQRSRDANDAP